MSNWIHQWLRVSGVDPDTAQRLSDELADRHWETGYSHGSDLCAGDVTIFLDDRIAPRICIAQVIAMSLPHAVVSLAWSEPMNVWYGSVVYRHGRVSNFSETNHDLRLTWSSEDGILRRHHIHYDGDPRVGDSTEELKSEERVASLVLRDCALCRDVKCDRLRCDLGLDERGLSGGGDAR